MSDEFSSDIHDEIGSYVYRLIDPRTDETFYVGKGKGNRVFAHAKDKKSFEQSPDDILPPKIDLIQKIKDLGLSVKYIIHRWGLTDDLALLAEAVLIDAYPKLANEVLGHHSRKYGLITPEELEAQFSKEEIVFEELVLLVDITRTFSARNPKRLSAYDAARWAWPISRARAKDIRHVLAHRDGCVIAVFEVAPEDWMDAADLSNFPDMYFSESMKDAARRWSTSKLGFRGVNADEAVSSRYMHKRIPKNYRNSQTGVRYAPTPA